MEYRVIYYHSGAKKQAHGYGKFKDLFELIRFIKRKGGQKLKVRTSLWLGVNV